MAYMVMAFIVTVRVVMAYTGMALIVMASIGQYSHGHNQLRRSLRAHALEALEEVIARMETGKGWPCDMGADEPQGGP